MSGLPPACVFRSAGTCHRFGFLPVGWAARLGVAGQDVAGQGTCRPVGTVAGWGGDVLSLATFRTEWDAKPNVTRVVSRVSGCDGSEGMDVA
jgi:hypothetical protein